MDWKAYFIQLIKIAKTVLTNGVSRFQWNLQLQNSDGVILVREMQTI